MPQKSFLKKVFFVLIVSCIIILVIYFWMLRNSQFIYNEPIGGREPIKVEIENQYAYDTDIKNAAVQLGEAFQQAIDDPIHALEIYPVIDAALSCAKAVIEKKGLEFDEYIKLGDFVEDISTKGYLRQRRYIRHNVNLSGRSYPLDIADITKCKFKYEDK